ncbi:MAG: amino acid adenylation domain-containing protein [Burkholderiales bacterium]
MSAHVTVAARLAALPPEKRSRLKAILNRVAMPSIDSAAQPLAPGHKLSHESDASVSFAQTRLWFLHRYQPDSAVYNVARAFRLTGRLDVSALSGAFAEIVRRHAILRTGFAMVGDEARQAVHVNAAFKLDTIDLLHFAQAQRETEAQRVIDREANRPFDLERPPLLRAMLVALLEDDHALLINLHHIVADGWSLEVLGRELAALYRAYRDACPSLLPELPIQYTDYARWQREWLRDKALTAQLDYWKQKLKNAPPLLALPTDRPRPQTQSLRRAQHICTLDQSLLEDLKALNQQSGTTLFMSLLAAFAVVLARYSRSDDIVIGSPIAGRSRAETENLIGCFVNTLALRVDLSGDPSFAGLLSRVRETALEAYAHQDLPFEKLVEELKPERGLSHAPLFQVAFVLQNSACPLALDSLAVECIEIGVESAKFDLNLGAADTGQGLRLSFEYNADLFDAATIVRLAGHLETLLRDVAADSDCKLSQLALLTPAEQYTLTRVWNQGKAGYPADKTITALFEEQAARTPHNIALVCEGQALSYAELNDRANRLAHHLIALGGGPEVLIGLCIERSAELIVAILAILKAGSAYLPLDPSYPEERLAFMLDDAKAPLVITQTAFAPMFARCPARLVLLDAPESHDYPTNNPAASATSENLAYVIYTSGSTGKPKGVMISHANVHRLFTATDSWYRFGASDVWTLFHSYAFDFSVWEIWGALLYGGRLVVVPYAVSRSPDRFYQLLVEQQVTVLNQTPSAFYQLIQADHAYRGEQPLRLRCVIFGGEALNPALLGPWYLRHRDDSPRLVNMYGITETTVHVTYQALSEADARGANRSLIGCVIPDLSLYILDQHRQPVAIGCEGELYVGGAGLARGYLNRPELTAERYIRNPFSADPDARLYKTGDLARYLSDGNIEYLGRIDHQVKIRGFRIELGEIESLLAQHADVREAAVIARDDAPGDKRLVAYLVARPDTALTQMGLRSYLQGKLPDHMMPAAFVMLDAMPVTSNGKLDRAALPAPNEMDVARAAYAAPQTAMETAVADIYREVLKISRISREDNFFDLGGHSLLATQLIVHLRVAFQIELPLQALFDAPTVAALSGIIAASAAVAKATCPAIATTPTSAATSKAAPLSFAQARLWFLHQYEPDSAFYNLPRALMLKGAVRVDALAAAFDSLIARHEALRTVFTVIDDEPVQVIKPAAEFRLERLDLRYLPESARRAEALRLAQADAIRPFDLSKSPLRMNLVTIASDEHLLVINLHHIVSDGWSMAVFNRELSALYESHSEGMPSRLAPLPIQYADYARWQRGHLQGRLLATDLTYWKAQLGNAPPLLDLPTDRPRPPSQSFKGSALLHQVEKDVLDRVKAVGQRNRATLFMTLSAAFSVLLARYTRRDDIVFGSVIAGRTRIETENLIGFFVNTLVMRIDCANDPAFEELLGRVRETALDAYAHQDVPFERLFEELKPERNPSYSPLIQVLFVLQNNTVEPLRLKGATVERIESRQQTAKFDLSLAATETAQGLQLNFEYSTDLFDAATIARMAGHYSALLAAIAADPGRKLSTLPLLTASERQTLVYDWNQTATGYPAEATLAALFEQQVARTPNRVAVVLPAAVSGKGADESMTYAELNQRANRLAHYLLRLGAAPDMLIGVCAQRSIEMTVSILAILKAGAAYLPLDPGYPRERLAFMLEDAGATILITHSALRSRLPQHAATLVMADQTEAYAECPAGNPNAGCDRRPDPEMSSAPRRLTSANLAYVIYTSGSAGKPKGVMVEQRSVVRLVKNTDYAQLTADDAVAHISNTAFDAATFELWGALLNGGRLVIIDQDTLLSPEHFAAALAKYRISALFITVALFNMIAREAPTAFAHVRHLLVGGDALDPQAVASVLRAAPPERLLNAYGPTETTTFATWHQVREVAAGAVTLPIGRPVANTTAYILDAHLQPAPIGVAGELHIGGPGVARGYLARPELTAAKFIADPFDQGGRLYKTGDLARFLPGGSIEFVGRIDSQVKIRGFRIELGEIEASLCAHPEVREAVVLARQDEPGDKRLVAYIVPARTPRIATNSPFSEGGESGHEGNTPALREHLKTRLPDYMIPTAFVLMAQLPITPNGKLDRANLPAPGGDTMTAAVHIAPRTPLEAKLAAIWRKLLHIDAVGVTSNFFELGGHSLLVVRLIAEIDKAFGQQLSIATLFQAPTIARLAEVMTGDRPPENWPSLLPLNAAGSTPPLFSMHVGTAVQLRGLARHLGQEQTFYGISSQCLDARREPLHSIEEMAAYALREVRAVQPRGPYHLAGYCASAAIALEMAQQLHGQGERVSALIMFDAAPPGGCQDALQQRRELRRHLRNLARFGVLKKIRYVASRVRDRSRDALYRCAFRFYRALGAAIPHEVLSRYVLDIMVDARARYAPRIYPGKISLIWATVRSQDEDRDTRCFEDAWAKLAAQGVEHFYIPVEHTRMFEDDQVACVAEQTKACLARASAS